MWYCLTEILTESGTDAAEERECEVDQYLVGPLVDLKSGGRATTTTILS